MKKPVQFYTKSDIFVWFLTYVWLVGSIVLFKVVSGYIIAIVITLGVLFATNFKLTLGSFHKHVLAFYIFCLFSVFWALNYHYVLFRSTTILEIFICMCVFYDYYIRLNNYTILLKIIVYAGYTISIYSFFYWGWDSMYQMAMEGVRLGNDYANVNDICMMAATSVIIDVYLSLYNKKLRWSLIFAIPTLILISFGQSRKALFMVFFTPILLYVYKNSRNLTKDLRPLLKIIFGLFIVGFIASLFYDSNLFAGIVSRMESLIYGLQGSEETDSSTLLRFEMIELGIQTFLDNPILGIGIGNSDLVMSRELGQSVYFHNNYVELLACGGIVGTLIYYSIHIDLLRQLLRYRKNSSVAVLFLMLILTSLITDYGAVSYFGKTTYFNFMMYFAFLEHCKMTYGRRGSRFLKPKSKISRAPKHKIPSVAHN